MPRRAALAHLALAALVLLAGCGTVLQDERTGPAGNLSPTSGLSYPPPNSSTAETLSVGSPADLPGGTDAHQYAVVNGNESAHRVSVTVWEGGTVVANRTWALPPNTRVAFDVYDPAAYAVEVDLSGAPPGGYRDEMAWDCNAHRAFVVIFGGSLAVGEIHTDVGCSGL